MLVVSTGQQEAANGGDGFEHLTCRQAVDVIDGNNQSTVDGLDQPGKNLLQVVRGLRTRCSEGDLVLLQRGQGAVLGCP